LRDNEGLTGEKALRTLSHLLTWKLLEQHFGGEINIDEYEYKFEEYFEDEVLEHNKNRLLLCVRFSNLINENEENLPNIMKYIWDIILSEHPSTKNIFLKGEGFKIQRQTSYKRLLDKLNELPITNNDILGDAYEEVTKDIMKGKVLGQFFTPHSVKSLMIELINPQIYEDGTIETFCDPTMGTAGFLVSYLKNIVKKSTNKNIQLDWNFIKTQGIYGKEIEPDTYQLAMSNMLISSGHVFECLERGDSIRNPIMRKFDNILANPPFGIKGLKYNEFQLDEDIRNSYIPIKSDNAVSLFIQAIICMLNINGKCAIVLPDGQDLFSKSNKTLIAIREYLMKTCDLKEIIYLPSGIFTYTSIKTCVFNFVKKVEGSEVMEIKFKKNKNIETRTDYKFLDTHQTISVKFYDYNPYENIKNLLVDVPIEKISNNSYSLNYAEYLENEKNNENDEDNENTSSNEIIVKTLGEVCEFKNGQNITKNKLINGEYPVVGGGKNPLGYHNEYNVNENTILISKDGAYAGYVSKYNSKVFVSNHGIYIINIKNNIAIKDYIYYYMKLISQNKIYLLQKGLAQPGINKEQISKIKILIPSLDKQNEIIQYLDFIYEKSNKTSEEKIKELKQLNEFCLNNQINYGNNNNKTLEEIFGTKINNFIELDDDLEYNVIGLSSNGYSKITKKINGSEIKIKRQQICELEQFCISKILNGCYGMINEETNKGIISSEYWLFNINTSLINKKYLNYIFKNQIYNNLKIISDGVGIPRINYEKFKKIIISIPSIKKQREIIEYCDRNSELIKQLENEIKNNKKIAKEFIDNILDLSTNINESEMIEDDESHLKTCRLEDTDESDLKINEEEEYEVEFEE
jgi:type I restriction-modification system DNA methylase subunit